MAKKSVTKANAFVTQVPLPEFKIWEKMRQEHKLFSFDLELTARCNNNCRHCYINLPQGDELSRKKELTFSEIKSIVDQAVSLGAVWCLLTGGEPLLREDFFEIYLYLKKKGLLVSIFSNATLINLKHIALFKQYPPRDIEVTVYGVTGETCESLTRRKGSFNEFIRGLELLLKNGVKVRFKAMAVRSNVHELPLIAQFCRERTKDYFRFDPFLHLRFDGNIKRNEEIKSERLTPKEIVNIEQADSERYGALKKNCDQLINHELEHFNCNHLFHCGTGQGSFSVSYDGFFRLCSSLWHPDCIYDLKKGSLAHALNNFVSGVRDLRSSSKDFLEKCRKCALVNLCIWCPAHAYLETKQMDTPVEYFCQVAHARAEMLSPATN